MEGFGEDSASTQISPNPLDVKISGRQVHEIINLMFVKQDELNIS
jgi:hypothetical protein